MELEWTLTAISNHKLHADSEPGRTVYNLRQEHDVFDRNLTTRPGQPSSSFMYSILPAARYVTSFDTSHNFTNDTWKDEWTSKRVCSKTSEEHDGIATSIDTVFLEVFVPIDYWSTSHFRRMPSCLTRCEMWQGSSTLPWPHVIQDDPGGPQATSVTLVMTFTERERESSFRTATFAAQCINEGMRRFWLHVAERQVGPIWLYSHRVQVVDWNIKSMHVLRLGGNIWAPQWVHFIDAGSWSNESLCRILGSVVVFSFP